jgi:hypothetical protein
LRLERWGIIDAWMSRAPTSRRIVLTNGITALIVDENIGELIVRASPDEDLSQVVLKATEKLERRAQRRAQGLPDDPDDR